MAQNLTNSFVFARMVFQNNRSGGVAKLMGSNPQSCRFQNPFSYFLVLKIHKLYHLNLFGELLIYLL